MAFCQQCGAKLAEGALFCTECGAKINNDDKFVFKKGQSRLDLEGVKSHFSEEEEINFENFSFKKQSPAKVFILSVITFGIYGLVLLYRWLTALNKVRNKEVFSPTLAVILSVISLGIASIYFSYKTVKEFELLTKELGDANTNIKKLTPPPKNIKELVLYGFIFIFVLSFISGFTLFIPLSLANGYLIMIIQNAAEYSLSLKAIQKP